jgi:hypothetical protein
LRSVDVETGGKTMRALLLAAMVAAISLGASVSAEAAPPKGRPLGGVNLTYYCQVHYGSNYKAAVLGSTAYDWRCVPVVHHAGTVNHPISVANACLLQYGLTGLIAYASNPGDPTSWRCYSGGPGNHPK